MQIKPSCRRLILFPILFGGPTVLADQSYIEASFISEYERLERQSPVITEGKSVWRSFAWRGEQIQKQILIKSRRPIGRLSYSASDLLSDGDRITGGNVTFFSPSFVRGDVAANDCEGYDGGRPTTLLTDALAQRLNVWQTDGQYYGLLWVRVDVPRDVAPGNYNGTVSLMQKGRSPVELDITVDVNALQMPESADEKFHLDLWQFPEAVLQRHNDQRGNRPIELWSKDHYELLAPIYKYLARLGQRAVTTYIKDGALGAPSMIRWIAHDGGSRWTFDYSIFDRHVETLNEWGINRQISAFSPIGWNKTEISFFDADTDQRKKFSFDVGSPQFNALWNLFLADFKKHLIEKGWFEKTVLYMDEIPADEMRSIIGLIHYNSPDWKIGLAYSHAQPADIIGSLYDVAGIFETEERVETYNGQTTSFYTSCSQIRPNVYLAKDADPADLTAFAWYALKRGYNGYLRWAFDNWKSQDPYDLSEGRFTAGDFSLVYRSGNTKPVDIVPSVRSELLRDGIEDYEKALILQEKLKACKQPAQSAALRSAIDDFTSRGLKAGESRQLVQNAKAKLHQVSRAFADNDCALP